MEFEIDSRGHLLKVILSKGETEVVIPDNVVCIDSNAFYNCNQMRKVTIPNSVEIIKDKAFSNNYLSEISIPSSVKEIGKKAFSGSYFLNKVEIKGPLKKIEEDVFSDCSSLKEIVLPETVEIIEKSAFSHCKLLESVKLSSNLKEIDNGAFYNCKKLKEIVLPDSISYIGSCAFSDCESLKEIKIPSSIKEISSHLFENCHSLENVEMGDNVSVIHSNAFSCCRNLKSITLPQSLINMGDYSFSNCRSLQEIEIPENVAYVGDNAFYSNVNLKKVILSNKLEEISKYMFCGCTNLKEIKFPSSIRKINENAFGYCRELENIEFNYGLEFIDSKAFESCISLKYLKFPKTIKVIKDQAFCFCTHLKEIYVPASLKNIGMLSFLGSYLDKVEIEDFALLKNNNFLNFHNYYINIKNKNIIASNSEINREEYKLINYKEMLDYLKFSNRCNSLILAINFSVEDIASLGRLQSLSNFIAYNVLNRENAEQLKESLKNRKEFNALLNRLDKFNVHDNPSTTYYDVFKLAYALGAFSDNKAERQRACEYIYNIIEKDLLSFREIHCIFENLEFRYFNKELSSFFFDVKNFVSLKDVEVEIEGFISSAFNNFENIREFGRSNKGSQNYRKVTVDMCKEYLSKVDFKGVDETNMDIAEEIAKYTHRQSSFETANLIRKEYNKLKENNFIDDHILIDELREKILEDVNDSLKNLNEVSKKSFTYEFLSKYDPRNFVLGKYCSCCAHLEGTGLSVTKASILHRDCQNLVIKDSKGRIIAKSTLYVNREQGYGVFNNVEINTSIKDNEEKELVYKKYIEAISVFAETYNKKNINKPLNIITVGMGLNDLKDQLIEYNEKEENLLEGMNFYNFGNYEGDWQKEQYVVWKKETTEKRQ